MNARPREDESNTAVFPSALGWMALAVHGDTVVDLTFAHATPELAMKALARLPQSEGGDRQFLASLVKRLQAFAEGAEDDFRDVAVSLENLTPFQRRVIQACRAIPYGQTRTYGQLAAVAGAPRAARAVGNVMRSNCVPLIVPCHRVVGSTGQLRGYSAGEGMRMKLRLLEMEARGTGSEVSRQRNRQLAGATA